MPETIQMPSSWRRNTIAVAIVGLLLAAVVCARVTQVTPQGDDHSRYHDRSFRVDRVIDGDTLDIAVPDGRKPVTRIRLWGVDTPEVSAAPQGEMYFGPEASRFAKDTLGGKSVHVVLSPDETRGKYGRLLAYVYLERGGRMFNEMLLEGGYAYADSRFKHHYSRQFRALEERARRAGRGLWAAVKSEQMPKWKRRSERKSAKLTD